MKPRNHVHVAMIKQWLDDDSLVVEMQDTDGRWHLAYPNWDEQVEYRFKPKTIKIGDVDCAVPRDVTSHHATTSVSFLFPTEQDAEQFRKAVMALVEAK